MGKSHDFFTPFAATTRELCSPTLISTRPIHLHKPPVQTRNQFLRLPSIHRCTKHAGPYAAQSGIGSLDYPFLEAELHNSLVNPIPFTPNP